MDIFEKELEIDYMEFCNEIETASDIDMISYMESGNSSKSKIESILTRFKTLIEKSIKKIEDLFNKKSTQNTTAKLQEALKINPSLKNKKVKVKDYRKVQKLENDTIKKIRSYKSPYQVEKEMEKYKKQRTALLAAIPVTAISVSAIGLYLIHGKNQSIKELDKRRVESESMVKNLRAVIKFKDKDLEEANNQLNAEKRKTSVLNSDLKQATDALKKEQFNSSIVKAEYALLKDNCSTVLNIANEYGPAAVGEVFKSYKERDTENYPEWRINHKHHVEKSGLTIDSFIKVKKNIRNIERKTMR